MACVTPLVGAVPEWVIRTDPKEWLMYPSNWNHAQNMSFEETLKNGYVPLQLGKKPSIQ
jgi:hypothetical protein